MRLLLILIFGMRFSYDFDNGVAGPLEGDGGGVLSAVDGCNVSAWYVLIFFRDRWVAGRVFLAFNGDTLLLLLLLAGLVIEST